MQLRRSGLLAVMALIAVACGGNGDGGDADGVAAPGTAPSTASATTATVAPPAAVEVEVPDAVLTDVASGEEVSLRSMVPSERPVLFWFWAPH